MPVRSAPQFRAFRWTDVCLILLLVGGTHFAYRVSIIGMPPFTDAGGYACFGYFAESGEPSTPCYPINLYPALVCSAGINHDTPLFRIRLIDALLCAISVSVTTLLIYRLTSVRPAIFLGLIWSTAWLHMPIGNAGFKNPIVPALGLLSASLLLWTYRGRTSLLVGGALIPLIPLVREPMAITALVLLISCVLLRGWRGLAISLVSGVVSGSILLGWICLYRGSPLEIVDGFRGLGAMLSAIHEPGGEAIRRSLTGGFSAGRGLALSGLIGCVFFLTIVAWKRKLPDWQLFFIAVLLLLFPLLEIAVKHPIPYHWIQLGLGLLLFASLGYRALADRIPLRAKPTGLLVANVTLAALLYVQLSGNYDTFQHSIALSKRFEPVMVEGNWEHTSVSQSFYLRTAKFIRDNTEEDDPIFVSGFYYVLYPLSQRLPPDVRYHDATFASLAGLHEKRTADVDRAFRAHPPKLVVESLRWEDTPQQIQNFVRGFPDDYELVAELPTDLSIHYGHFGARIWQLLDKRGSGQNVVETAAESARSTVR